jgi:hypothetical protein
LAGELHQMALDRLKKEQLEKRVIRGIARMQRRGQISVKRIGKLIQDT